MEFIFGKQRKNMGGAAYVTMPIYSKIIAAKMVFVRFFEGAGVESVNTELGELST